MQEEWIMVLRYGFRLYVDTRVTEIYLQGAQILSNQVSTVVHDLEQKRVDYFKTTEKLKKEKENNIKAFKVFID